MAISAAAPSLYLAINYVPKLDAFRNACRRLSFWSRLGLVLLMVALTLGTKWIFDTNPRDYHYLPLLLPVIATAIIFGFPWALFAVMVTALGADYFFALPEYSFVLTEWEDALGLAVFAVIGALVALLINDFRDFWDH